MTRLLAFIGLLLTLSLCQACSRTPESSSDANRPVETSRIRVVTTTGMIADMVRSIGGDDVEVTNLIGVGIDPHLYKPTRDDVASLLAADMIFYNGLHLEGRMGDVLERAGSDRPTIAVTDGLTPDQLLDGEDETGHEDPHVWLAPVLWAQCGTRVLDALCEKAPDRADRFNASFNAWTTQAESLEAFGRNAIGSIPVEKRLLITSHDAFNYFGRTFDIEVVGVQGISTESEAGLADLEALVQLVVDRKVPAVFVESSVPRRSIQALIEGAAARGHDVVVGGELFSDSMGPAGTPEGTWHGMVDHDIRVVTEALGGTLPAAAGTASGGPPE
jgi:manganese/zinc/iron transport system substrate-binding protein